MARPEAACEVEQVVLLQRAQDGEDLHDSTKVLLALAHPQAGSGGVPLLEAQPGEGAAQHVLLDVGGDAPVQRPVQRHLLSAVKERKKMFESIRYQNSLFSPYFWCQAFLAVKI